MVFFSQYLLNLEEIKNIIRYNIRKTTRVHEKGR